MFKTKKAGIGLALIIAVLFVSFGFVYGQTGQTKAKVNINTAGAAELEGLPRIGPKVAQRIIDYRTKNGNYQKVEDIMKVQGIGEKVFAQIKDMITVGQEKSAK